MGVYAAPLLVGPVLILFMIKPLFARRETRENRVALVRQNEPVLFDFIDRLCEAVRAPKPVRIDIDCEVNASASLRRGMLSLFGYDMVLTIGIPLIAGMTVRQFTGVLAHEFGHFAQGLGMRMHYIIYLIDQWFCRVVHERDTLDEKLIAMSEDDASWLTVFVLLAQMFVWLTRKLLWLLMMVGRIVSCLTSRQMEYDADRYETQVVGSATFQETGQRLMILTVAAQTVGSDLYESWRDRRLGDDYPFLVVSAADGLPSAFRETIITQLEDSKTKLLATHPSTSDRAPRSAKENAKGIFHTQGPASMLFRNFDATSKAITVAYYLSILGSQFRRENLISTEALRARQKEILRGEQAAERYFGDCLTFVRPLSIDPFSMSSGTTPKECLRKLKQARAAIVKSLSAIQKTHQTYMRAEKHILEALMAEVLVAANVKIETVLKLRLDCGLSLLAVDQVRAKLKGADKMQRRSKELLEGLAALSSVAGEINRLMVRFPAIRAMVMILSEVEPEEKELARARRMREECSEAYSGIRRGLASHRYPFAHADGEITMADYAFDSTAALHDLGDLLSATEIALDNACSLYMRMMGELAVIAEHVELAIGLKPLKAPAQNELDSPESSDD